MPIVSLQGPSGKMAAVNADGSLPVQLNGRKAARVQTVLTTTPLGASAPYVQPGVDAEAWTGANGTGAVVVSGMAKADKPGTLFLEVSHDNVTWIVWDAALANSTGTARLKPITIPLRYFRFRYVNGDQAQTSFALVQNIMQEGDGRGGEHGQGTDCFRRWGTLAANTTETVIDLRSPVELMSFQQGTNSQNSVWLILAAYKDDGSLVQLPWGESAGTGSLTSLTPAVIATHKNPWFENAVYDTTGNNYLIQNKAGARLIFARGLKVVIQNVDTVNAYNVSVHSIIRLL